MGEFKVSERVCVIINPNSQGGRTEYTSPHTLKSLKGNGIVYDAYTTIKSKHSIDIVKDLINDYDVFVGVGGDGLLHEMAQVLVNKKDKKLAIVPSGNGNMFASHHWIKNLDDAINSIKKHSVEQIDLIKITYKTKSQTKTIYSHCIFGVGYISDVVRLAVNHFRKLGPKACYPISGILGTLYVNQFKANITTDKNKEEINKLSTFIGLNQGKVGPFDIVENSSDKDGFVDYVMFKNAGRLEALLCVFDAAVKSYYFNKHRATGKAKKIKIELSEPKKIMIDGEMYNNVKSFNAKVVPKSLNVLSLKQN